MPETNKFKPQSGVIPYLICGNDLYIMLVTSKKMNKWITPKGNIQKACTPRKSAVYEAYEEAGIEGEISHTPIGNYRYSKSSGNYEVEVFLFKINKIHDTWPESEFRLRKLFTVNQARKLIASDSLGKLFLKIHLHAVELENLSL